jgi:hypothetical protein
MFKLLRRLEQVFAAVAFAEYGEFETALAIANEDKRSQAKKSKRKTGPQYRARA